MAVVCNACIHQCSLEEGQTGFCRGRKNVGGAIKGIFYGKITSIALDPIEKKPLAMFYPGSRILSVGSGGCNLRCPFCQNHQISMAGENELQTADMPPEQLIGQAKSLQKDGNIGLAYTYNEPLVGYEYVRDCSRLAKEAGMKNVVVTNGCFSDHVLREILPYVDAMNVDLKSFSGDFYRKAGGDMETVKHFIREASRHCHVEVTTLVVPGMNDSLEEMQQLSHWLASVSPQIPLHVTRFFPQFHMSHASPTPVSQVYRLAQAARDNLHHVFVGNC